MGCSSLSKIIAATTYDQKEVSMNRAQNHIVARNSIIQVIGLLLAFTIFPLAAAANTATPTAQGWGQDDWNKSQLYPYPSTYQTYCSWILNGLNSEGFTPTNGWNFAFAGSGNNVPNIPFSDFTVNIDSAWVVTNDPVKALDNKNYSRPVNMQDGGGADFEISYQPRAGSTDPASVNFVQAYVESTNGGPFSKGTNDNNGWTQGLGGSPYYNGTQPDGSKGVGGTLGNISWMLDIPYTCENGLNSVPDCVGGVNEAITQETVEFQVFVAGTTPVDINGVPTIILYGGDQWGYQYTTSDTAPEPPTLALYGSGILGLSQFLRKRLLTRV